MRAEVLRDASDRNLTRAFAALIPHVGTEDSCRIRGKAPGWRSSRSRTYRPLRALFGSNKPVAAAAAIISDEVVGICAVGTAARARRRGFGRAIIWAAIETGVRAGCQIAVLQSSEMAVSLYQGRGFVEVCRYVEYQRTEPSSTA